MKLTIADRRYIINTAASKGSMMTMMVVKDIQKKVEIGQTEVAEIELRDKEGGGLVWNREKAIGSFDVVGQLSIASGNDLKLGRAATAISDTAASYKVKVLDSDGTVLYLLATS